jgi:protein gp37
MAETTGIEWAHSTFNPWIGCTKVSPACDHCYAETLAVNRMGLTWGAGEPRRRTSIKNWKGPITWNAKALKAGERRRVFTASLADVFDAEVPDKWRQDLFSLIDETPALDWLVLTKRPKLMAEWSKANRLPANVWAGTTVENQPMADLRIPFLLNVDGPRVRFLSMEPLLARTSVSQWLSTPRQFQRALDAALDQNFVREPEATQAYATFMRDRRTAEPRRVDWVIAGGESGRGARWSHIDWFRLLRDQCRDTGVPFHFKQWGDWAPGGGGIVESRIDGPDFKVIDPEYSVRRIGKAKAGRLLDGRTWDGVPQPMN